MTNKIQTGGYVTGFRVGEMILDVGGRLPIIEIEYRPHPTSPDNEMMNIQLVLRPDVANRLLVGLQGKIDEVSDRKASMN